MRMRASLPFALLILVGAGCRSAPPPPAAADSTLGLAGQWRASLQFSSGAFAPVKDLEFMYAFNPGGTMTESSNYDAAPPVPPAYGIWRKVGPREFEAKYEFYVTKAPTAFAELAKGGGWGPAGRGVFVERISISEDGKSF
ncbi:MAG TPA: hypothetical protein VJQ44_09045, partial [Gemmatimonadales bacterium]|nr:hypothetical protein [Gemmatimonadales bacterium]